MYNHAHSTNEFKSKVILKIVLGSLPERLTIPKSISANIPVHLTDQDHTHPQCTIGIILHEYVMDAIIANCI